MKKHLKPLALAINLAVFGASAQAAPRGALEAPEAKDIDSGIINVMGWATDDMPGVSIKSITMSIDDGPAKSIAYGADRWDVKNRFPDDADALKSGYAATISTKNLSNGAHTITIEIQNELNETRTISRTFYVSNPPKGEKWWDNVDLSAATARVSGQRVFLDNVMINGRVFDNVALTFDRRTSGFQFASWVNDLDKDGYADDDLDKDGYHDDDKDKDGYHDDDKDKDGFKDEGHNENMDNDHDGGMDDDDDDHNGGMDDDHDGGMDDDDDDHDGGMDDDDDDDDEDDGNDHT